MVIKTTSRYTADPFFSLKRVINNLVQSLQFLAHVTSTVRLCTAGSVLRSVLGAKAKFLMWPVFL